MKIMAFQESDMNEILQRIGQIQIVPVVVMNDAAQATPMGEALLRGGLPCAEVTFRTSAAVQAIKQLSRLPEMLVGAGTVLSVDQVKAAVDANAKFIVSPGLNPKVVAYCVENQIPITPGVCTPSDIEAAHEFGLRVLKFFPAEAFGGLKTLKAISAPYGMMKFIPTGGIDASNIVSYLKFPRVLACGGSWMVKPSLLDTGDWAEVERLSHEAVSMAQQASDT